MVTMEQVSFSMFKMSCVRSTLSQTGHVLSKLRAEVTACLTGIQAVLHLQGYSLEDQELPSNI